MISLADLRLKPSQKNALARILNWNKFVAAGARSGIGNGRYQLSVADTKGLTEKQKLALLIIQEECSHVEFSLKRYEQMISDYYTIERKQ